MNFCLKLCLHKQCEVSGNLPAASPRRSMLDCREKLGGAASGPGKVGRDELLSVSHPSPKPRVFTVRVEFD